MLTADYTPVPNYFHSKARGMLLKGRIGLTSSMAWAVAKQLAAVSLSVSNV